MSWADRGGIGSESKGGGEFCRWMSCGVDRFRLDGFWLDRFWLDEFWLDGFWLDKFRLNGIVNLVKNKSVPKNFFWWGNFRLFFSFILN